MAGLLNNEKYAKYYQGLSLMYERPEVRASLEVILSVFMVTTLILVAIRPTVVNIAGLQKKIGDQEVMNLKADKKIGQLFSAAAQLTDYREQLPLFERTVPGKLSYFELAARLELVARKESVTIDTLTMPGVRISGQTKVGGDWAERLTKAAKDGTVTADMSLTAYGSSKGVLSYLKEIENMDKLILIKNVMISKESGVIKGNERLKLTVQFQSYFVPENNET